MSLGQGDFYAPGSNDRGHVVFVLSVCLFVFIELNYAQTAPFL